MGWWAGLCAVLAAGAGMAQAMNADRSCDTLCSRPARSAARVPRAICAHVLLALSVFEVVVSSRHLLGRVGDDGLEVGVRHAPAVEGPGALFRGIFSRAVGPRGALGSDTRDAQWRDR